MEAQRGHTAAVRWPSSERHTRSLPPRVADAEVRINRLDL
jgi:hypothetical protein